MRFMLIVDSWNIEASDMDTHLEHCATTTAGKMVSTSTEIQGIGMQGSRGTTVGVTGLRGTETQRSRV